MEIAYSQEKRKYSKQKLRIISSQYNETNHNLQIKNKVNIETSEKDNGVITNKAINVTKAIAKHH